MSEGFKATGKFFWLKRHIQDLGDVNGFDYTQSQHVRLNVTVVTPMQSYSTVRFMPHEIVLELEKKCHHSTLITFMISGRSRWRYLKCNQLAGIEFRLSHSSLVTRYSTSPSSIPAGGVNSSYLLCHVRTCFRPHFAIVTREPVLTAIVSP